MPYRAIKNFCYDAELLTLLQNYVYRLYDLCVQFELCVYDSRMSWQLHNTWEVFIIFAQIHNLKIWKPVQKLL